MFWKLYVLELLRCVQLRFVTLSHVTFTLCCFTLCSNIHILMLGTVCISWSVYNTWAWDRCPWPLPVCRCLCSGSAAVALLGPANIGQKCGRCFHHGPNIYKYTKPLKGLSHEIDFENIDKNWRMLALISAAAGFRIFRRRLCFLVEIKHSLSGKC